MIIYVCGCKSGVSTNKSTGERYNFCKVYYLRKPESSFEADHGLVSGDLFFRVSSPVSYDPGYYNVLSDLRVFNGQPQVRLTGLCPVDPDDHFACFD